MKANFPATLQSLYKALNDQRVDRNCRSLILALVSYAPEARPSISALSNDTGLSPRSVSYTISKLRKMGLKIESGREDRKPSTYNIVEFLKILGFKLDNQAPFGAESEE